METIDNFPLDTNSNSQLTLSPFNFRLLLSTIAADRMAYYGLRAVMILYAVDNLGITRENALYHYGYLTLAVCIAQLIGGFLGDFVLGARNGVITGFGLCILGALTVTIQDPMIFYVGVVLIALGSGFTRSNTYSLIGHYTPKKNIALLEKRFIALYGFLNFGALLSTLIIAYVGDNFGYIYSFIIVLALYGLSLFITLMINPKRNTSNLTYSESSKPPRPITTSLLVIILIIISCSLFWIIYEQYSMHISISKIEYVRSMFSEPTFSFVMWSSPVILLLVLMIPYYFFAQKISNYFKIAIGMALIGLCWGAAFLFDSEILGFGISSLVFLAFLESVAELFVSPTALTLLSTHSTKRYFGVIFGIYSLIIYFGMRLLYYSESSYFESLFQIVLVVFLIALIALCFIIPFILKEKNNSDMTSEEEI